MTRSTRPPRWQTRLPEVLRAYQYGSTPELEAALRAADTAKGYLDWSAFRHRPAPAPWSAEDLWVLVKFRRSANDRPLKLLTTESGRPFRLNRSDPMAAALHRIDTREVIWKDLTGGGGEGPHSDVSYRLMAAIEEAHHSGAIEGAVTTRRQSRELIRSGRKPRHRSEQMVLNNFLAIEQLDEWCQSPLTPDLICEIQAVIARDTLDDPADVGRIRTDDDDVHVLDASTGELVHTPPPASELNVRLKNLCEFANAQNTDELFLHPVIRAILIHHQLAYDHPFADGNGRTARALFMWSILRSGYGWFRSLSVSRAVHHARSRYYKAFQEVVSDENDVTYFVRQQLRCIEREIEHLAGFLGKRAALERWLSERKAITHGVNSRQLALLDHALDHPDEIYTAREHRQVHGVTQPTAWKDLTTLVQRGLLDEEKAGRKSLYRLSKKLKRLAKERP